MIIYVKLTVFLISYELALTNMTLLVFLIPKTYKSCFSLLFSQTIIKFLFVSLEFRFNMIFY